MRFEWEDSKNRKNLRKHDVSFETVILVFDDPFALTRRDLTFEAEERWITLGALGAGSILLVVHTFYEEQNDEVNGNTRSPADFYKPTPPGMLNLTA